MAHSPSLCAILCMAVGATQMGEDTLSPRTVVSVGVGQLEVKKKRDGVRKCVTVWQRV